MFSPTRQYKNYIRLHCGEIWSDRIEKALVTIGRLAEDQRRYIHLLDENYQSCIDELGATLKSLAT